MAFLFCCLYSYLVPNKIACLIIITCKYTLDYGYSYSNNKICCGFLIKT